jgi:hypothetical protein
MRCYGYEELKIKLDDLKINYEDPMKLFRDINFVNSIADNPIQHYRTNHIKIDQHYQQEIR